MAPKYITLPSRRPEPSLVSQVSGPRDADVRPILDGERFKAPVLKF
jgi:hypothetical protein